MEGKHEKHSDLSPGRILEKKINSWIAKIRASRFSPEIENNLEIIISATFSKGKIEDIATNPKEILIVYEMLGNELKRCNADDEQKLIALLDNIENDLKEIRAREN